MHGDNTAIDSTRGDTFPRDEQIAYSARSAARVLDISERQVVSLITTGKIESFKIGKSRRITRTALLDFVQRQQVSLA
jgi:excisionase family DNA binding protein